MIIPTFKIPFYPIFILLSLILGLLYIYVSIKKEKGFKKESYLYILMFILFIFIIAKLFTYFTSDNKDFFRVGLSSYGGFIGIILSAFIFEKMLPMNGKLFKYSMISILLIYSISKIGCFLAGCCYGRPFDSFFSVIYPDGLNIKLFPVQIVETFVFFILFLICNRIKDNKHINEIVIISGATCKFLLDFLRYDHVEKMITVNQMFSIVLVIIVIIYLVYRNIFDKKIKSF